MTDPAPDPFAAAKSNLQETVKWLATSLSGLGAAVLAGASINGLTSVEGTNLYLALAFGGAGLVSILAAIAILLNLLAAKPFYFSDLLEAGNPIAGEIQQHARDLLSPQTPTVADLAQRRQQAVQDGAAAQPGSAAQQQAFQRYTEANVLIGRVTALGQYLALRRDFLFWRMWLFALTVLVIACVGGYIRLTGGKAAAPDALAPKVAFAPGAGWSALADAYAKVCGGDPLQATMLPTKTFDGWVSFRLEGPGKCAGLQLSAPVDLVKLTSGP